MSLRTATTSAISLTPRISIHSAAISEVLAGENYDWTLGVYVCVQLAGRDASRRAGPRATADTHPPALL